MERTRAQRIVESRLATPGSPSGPVVTSDYGDAYAENERVVLHGGWHTVRKRTPPMSPRLSVSTLKILLAIGVAVGVVIAAGVVIGQAPAIFGVDDEPEASITFDDQTTNGSAVEIESVETSDGGFITITNAAGETLVVSGYLSDGAHENVTVEVDEDDDVELLGRLTATVHQDTTDDQEYAFDETDGEEDRPYVEDGYPVSDTASVTLGEYERDEDVVSDSFWVESIDVPSPVSTNETVEVVASIRNPTDVDNRQGIELRIDGTLQERKLIELEPEESGNVTYELDTSTLEPGDRTIGVYTPDDGELATMAVEYDVEPELEIVDANDSAATVNASLPADGFLAVENESEIVRGTSENLTAGEHDNVTVEFERGPDDETLAVVMYEGVPDDYDEDDGFPEADPIAVDGERIQATVPFDENGPEE